MSIYEDDLIERVGMSQQEACDELEIEQFKANLTIINEDNIHAAFEVYTKAEIVQMILNDGVAIKVDGYEISQGCIYGHLPRDTKDAYDALIDRFGFDAVIDKGAIFKEITSQKLNNLLEDYEISA